MYGGCTVVHSYFNFDKWIYQKIISCIFIIIIIEIIRKPYFNLQRKFRCGAKQTNQPARLPAKLMN